NQQQHAADGTQESERAVGAAFESDVQPAPVWARRKPRMLKPAEPVPMILVALEAFRQTLAPDFPQHAGTRAVQRIEPIEIPAIAMRRIQAAQFARKPPPPPRIQQQRPRARQQ